MSNFITNISDFNNLVLIPFLDDFFTTNIGFVFVCVCVVVSILGVLRTLFRLKF